MSVKVYVNDLDTQNLVDFHNIGGISHALGRHLRHVQEAVFLYAYVYEGAESGDVVHFSGQYHTDGEVVDGADCGVELYVFRLHTWVAARLAQLGDDV